MSTDAPYMKIAPDVVLGERVRLAGWANLYGCSIGDDSFIGPFVEIQRGAVIGCRVKVQSHSFICSGVEIGDEVFVGHGVMFINDRFPRSTNPDGSLKGPENWTCLPTKIGKRASIGSNATILCGVTIGDDAIIGAGSVVTGDVEPRAIVAGNPARFIRYINSNGKE